MKKLGRLVIAVAVVVVGGYSAFWYYQAKQMQSLLQDELNQLNRSGYGFTVQYDRIEKGGYPWNVQIELLNPKIKTTKSQIGEKDEIVEVDVDGKIVHLFTISGQRKGVELKGNTYLNLAASKFLLKGEISGKINRIDPSNTKITLSHLDLFEVIDSQEIPRMSIDYGSLHLSHKELSQASQQISCNIDIQGLDSSNLFLSKEQKQSPSVISRLNQIFRAKLGKINFSSDLKIELPTKEEIRGILASPAILIANELPTIAVDVDEWSLSDKHHTIGGKFHFKLQEKKNISVGTLIDVKTKISDSYYQLLAESIDQLEKEMAAAAPSEEQMRYLEVFKTNIPLLKKSGIDSIDVDWSLETDRTGTNAKIVLSKFALSNDSRGLYAHGHGEVQDKDTAAQLVIDLHNYRELIRDSIEYYNKILVTVAFLNNGNEDLFRMLPDGIADKVLKYLKAISDMPAAQSDDLKITMNFKNDAATVGTLSWKEFQDYTTHVTGDVFGSDQHN